MAALALILGVLALAGWGMAAGYKRELVEMQVSIRVLKFDVDMAEACLSVAENALGYWERVRVAEAEPPLTEIPAAFRQAFGEGE